MKNKNKDPDGFFLRFILNTGRGRTNRVLNLVELAKLIRDWYKACGGEEECLKEYNQKKSYLRRYLKVEKLVPYIKGLVEERKINTITIVDEISKFKPEDQGLVANAYLSSSSLTVQDMRDIRNWMKYNKKPIRECIEEFYEGRDGYSCGILNLDPESKIEDNMEEKLRHIFGKGLVEYKVEGAMFTVVLNDFGHRVLKLMARDLKIIEEDVISYILCRKRGLLKLSGEVSEKIMGRRSK